MFARFLDGDGNHFFRVKRRVSVADPEAASGNDADAAPLGVARLEDGVDLLAALVLLATGGCLTAFAVRVRRRFPLTLSQTFWYGVNYAIARFLWRARVNRVLPIPANRGAIVVCNHRSSLDPSFIEIATNRAVHWMVAKEYYSHWAFRRFLRMAETIPVSRGGIDTAATMSAIRIASQGGQINPPDNSYAIPFQIHSSPDDPSEAALNPRLRHGPSFNRFAAQPAEDRFSGTDRSRGSRPER